MAISVLDEFSQKRGLARVLNLGAGDFSGPEEPKPPRGIQYGASSKKSSSQYMSQMEIIPEKKNSPESGKSGAEERMEGSDEWEDALENGYDDNYLQYLEKIKS